MPLNWQPQGWSSFTPHWAANGLPAFSPLQTPSAFHWHLPYPQCSWSLMSKISRPPLSHPGLLFQSQLRGGWPRVHIPSGSRTSISGPGPLREMVTSFRSKGIFPRVLTASSWSVDSRCTLRPGWLTPPISAPGRQEREVTAAGARVMPCLCLAHGRWVPAGCQLRAVSDPGEF